MWSRLESSLFLILWWVLECGLFCREDPLEARRLGLLNSHVSHCLGGGI